MLRKKVIAEENGFASHKWHIVKEGFMGRFTNPRDLYFGEGARHEVKNLQGKRAVIVFWRLYAPRRSW